jgi:peptidoglycan/xylan/chitin deacetylase (PgdA/CDA1 family)
VTAAGGRRLLVLGWHSVEGTWRVPSAPGTGLRALERQLRAIARRGTIVPLLPALRALKEARPLPPRPVALTFDDGYRDNLTLAAPLLARLGLPATIFLVPGFLSREVVHWCEHLAWAFTRARARAADFEGGLLELGSTSARAKAVRLVEDRLLRCDRVRREACLSDLVERLDPAGGFDPDPLFLDWDGARTLARAGAQTGMTIGSHSLRHDVLSREPAEAQRVDLLESRHRLEHELEMPIDVFAYPFGKREHYDAVTVDAAKAAGYAYSLSTRAVWNTPATPAHEIRRRMLSPQQGVRGLAVVMARGLASAARDRLTEGHETTTPSSERVP